MIAVYMDIYTSINMDLTRLPINDRTMTMTMTNSLLTRGKRNKYIYNNKHVKPPNPNWGLLVC